MTDTALLCDILFPQKISPLTYLVPDEFARRIAPGFLVKAPLRKKEKKGVVLRCHRGSPEKRLESVTGLVGEKPYFTEPLLKLLEWGKEYYFSPYGLMLKSMLPNEILRPPRSSFSPEISRAGETVELPEGVFKELWSATGQADLKPFLFVAPSEKEESGLVMTLLKRGLRLLILSPVQSDAERLWSLAAKELGDGAGLFHSGLKRSERSFVIGKVLDGSIHVLVGTRSALFLPFSPEAILVTREHSTHYKQDETPRYNGRDMAVMRGLFEKVPVILSSQAPSAESWYNMKAGRYRGYIMRQSEDRGREFQVFARKKDESPQYTPFLSRRLLREVGRMAERNPGEFRALFIMHRLGMGILTCKDCGEVEVCPGCEIPLVLHKGEGLRCHHCGFRKTPPEACPSCGGFSMIPLGSGVEKVREDIEKVIGASRGFSAITDDHGRKRQMRSLDSLSYSGPSSQEEMKIPIRRDALIVGTLSPRAMKGLKLDLIVFLNPDMILNLPDFRAPERLCQDIFELRNHLLPHGKVILQTSLSWHHLYRCLKRADYLSFLRKELQERKEQGLPPFRKMIALYVYSRKETDLSLRLEEILKPLVSDEAVQMDGPFRVPPRLKGYSEACQILLLAERRYILRKEALKIIECIEGEGFLLRVDVDPVFL